MANWLFAQTTHVAVPKSKFACRVVSGVQFYISSFIKIGPVVLPLWVVENRPSPLLWPLAYTTACTTVQAVIIVNFQLRSSIHAGLTERSLYNRFALENLPKWGFGGILGGGVKIFGGNPPRNAMTADLRRSVKKLWRCSKYPSLYTRQRNYKKI